MKKSTIIWLVLIALAVIFLVGCTTTQGAPPPSGPIGGGCG